MGATTDTHISVAVAPDKMQAFVRVGPVGDRLALEAEKVLEALEKAKVAITEQVSSRVAELVKLLGEEKTPEEPFLVAKGTPSTEGQDGRFEWAEELQPKQREAGSDDQVDHYEQRIITVEEGAALGQVVPPVPSQEGADVHGNSLTSTRNPVEVQLGDNVKLADDGRTVLATVDGRVEHAGHRLLIHSVLEVKGDVDFKTGKINSAIDVHIRGSVQDLFEVRSKRSIFVQTLVGAATLEAGGDIVVKSGITGKDKGTVTAEGGVAARFCDAVTIRAGGDVEIIKEVINSRVRTDGRLVVARGALIGGWTHAKEGAEIRVLGSQADVKTFLSVGTDPEVCKKAAELDEPIAKHRQAAKKIQAAVQPLLAARKRLTASQRERATELIYEAQNLEAAVSTLEQQKQQMLDEAKPETEPVITVMSQTYSGVTMVVEGMAVTFDEPRRGHIKIMRRKVENVTEVVLVDQLSGSVTILPSSRYEF